MLLTTASWSLLQCSPLELPLKPLLQWCSENDREVVVTAYAHTLQKVIRIASPWSRGDYGPIREIEVVFLKILSFLRENCDFQFFEIQDFFVMLLPILMLHYLFLNKDI